MLILASSSCGFVACFNIARFTVMASRFPSMITAMVLESICHKRWRTMQWKKRMWWVKGRAVLDCRCRASSSEEMSCTLHHLTPLAGDHRCTARCTNFILYPCHQGVSSPTPRVADFVLRWTCSLTRSCKTTLPTMQDGVSIDGAIEKEKSGWFEFWGEKDRRWENNHGEIEMEE